MKTLWKNLYDKPSWDRVAVLVIIGAIVAGLLVINFEFRGGAPTSTSPLVFSSLIILMITMISVAFGFIFTGYRTYRIHGSILLLFSVPLVAYISPAAVPVAGAILLIAFFVKGLQEYARTRRFYRGGFPSGFSVFCFTFVFLSFLFVGFPFDMIVSDYLGFFAIPKVIGPGQAYSDPNGAFHYSMKEIIFYSVIYLLWGLLLFRTKMIPRSLRMPPRLRSYPRRGVTLIELLIVVAIIAITAPVFLHAVHLSSVHTARSRDARIAVQQARNEIERLRAAPESLESGTRTLPAETAGREMILVVGEPREDSLVPVALTFDAGPEVARETITFEALIAPAAGEDGS